MHYYDAEGDYNPMSGSGIGASGAECARESWCGLLDEAQTVLRTTLDEIALLAGVVTAETETHTPSAPAPSAYSLLLEPALFRFIS